MSTVIDKIEKEQCKNKFPFLRVGDIIRVSKTIVEGKKKRTQKFEGTIIKLQGSSSRKSITLRKVIDGVGVEKTYLYHSPLLTHVEMIQQSKVRRAKLYFLRDRIGAKASRLKVKA